MKTSSKLKVAVAVLLTNQALETASFAKNVDLNEASLKQEVQRISESDLGKTLVENCDKESGREFFSKYLNMLEQLTENKAKLLGQGISAGEMPAAEILTIEEVARTMLVEFEEKLEEMNLAVEEYFILRHEELSEARRGYTDTLKKVEGANVSKEDVEAIKKELMKDSNKWIGYKTALRVVRSGFGNIYSKSSTQKVCAEVGQNTNTLENDIEGIKLSRSVVVQQKQYLENLHPFLWGDAQEK